MRSEKGDGGWSVALRDGEGWEGGRRRYRVQNEEREKERDETMHAHGRQKVKRRGRERERCTQGTWYWHRGDEGATRLLLQCSK